ncbi:Molecular chaperone, HSP90 family [Pseudomonas aeruginosa]|nr:Molecular chaperone, HSP90 family [Pseudomonas aeruginosa]
MRPDERVDVQGLLWIQDGGTYGTSDNRNLSVFLRGMLLDDDARDLLPSWAGFVGGVI